MLLIEYTSIDTKNYYTWWLTSTFLFHKIYYAEFQYNHACIQIIVYNHYIFKRQISTCASLNSINMYQKINISSIKRRKQKAFHVIPHLNHAPITSALSTSTTCFIRVSVTQKITFSFIENLDIFNSTYFTWHQFSKRLLFTLMYYLLYLFMQNGIRPFYLIKCRLAQYH